ncbi:MAG TPA: PQQ-binding-like beta-propeller repeat protein [Rhizomicrobium sp.]|jgi:alcohol dehydrogenase (cytochrome c)|nr:PQQ-binding-like beta-propeller repeat protein [Rhizomicrobium sp.]
MRRKTALLLTAALVAAGGAFAQQAPGPFTPAQVEAGRAAFAESCASCHQADLSGGTDALPLAGSGFMSAWKTRSTAQLYKKIHDTMPANAPGSLDDATYADLSAFILHANGAKAGGKAFTPTTDVQIGSIANGTVPADVSHPAETAPTEASTAAHPSPTEQMNVPGRFVVNEKPGLLVEGHIQNYAPVTDATLTHPADGDWPMFRRNYQGWSYSPLNQVTAGNVANLQLKWMWSLNDGGTTEITPIVHDGIMFLSASSNTVEAMNAKTGELLWENRLGPNPRSAAPGGSTEETRSLGLYGNNVFVATPQADLYALDARSGKVVWKTHLTDTPRLGGNTGGVMVIHGKVLTGLTECGRKGSPDHCYISAYDAATGKRDWKFTTVALTGQPGGDSWGGLPDNDREGAETWIAGTYDPELNTTYWGTAQAKPWRRDLRGSGNGDTDYANSTVALDPDTGKLKWWFNHAPGESLDLDEVFERVLIDHGDQKTLMTIGKPGILWKLDRVTGKFLDAKQTLFQNVYSGFDMKTGKPIYREDIIDQKVDQWLASCPGPEGGHDWPATSYNQPTDTLIIPLSQSCVFMLGNGSQVYYEMPGTGGNMGRLSAYRTVDMKPLWSFQQRSPFLTAVLSTAGGVAFIGDFDRMFRAVDVQNGKTLWTTRLGTTVQGYPVSFSVDGKQYIAVTTGLGGGSPELKPGTMLTNVHRPANGQAVFVFGLPAVR